MFREAKHYTLHKEPPHTLFSLYYVNFAGCAEALCVVCNVSLRETSSEGGEAAEAKRNKEPSTTGGCGSAASDLI